MTELILEMQEVSKKFPGVQALNQVEFSVTRGEIHALVGQNGAGKSTLLKILAGVYQADHGNLKFNGQPISKWTPKEMIDRGICFIYQELNLIQSLSVAQNIFIGREPRNLFGSIAWSKMRADAEKALARINTFDIDVSQRLDQLTVAKQQLVAIARALNMDPELLILDEPTSRLGIDDAENLFAILNKMQDDGLSIVYVSHRLNEIYQIADRITVLRDGLKVITEDKDKLPALELVKHMVGENLMEKVYPSLEKTETILLDVENLSAKGVESVDLKLHAKEVLGLVGAVGAGKTETVRAIFGIDHPESGNILINGTSVKRNTPNEAIELGVALCPEDRKFQGLILDSSIRENITLAGLEKFTNLNLFTNLKKENEVVQQLIDRLRIVTPSIKKNVRSLSGGNQQKVVLSKWLCTSAQVFIFDEPTIGVDIQGKAEIYDLIHDLANQGAGVLFVTSDLDEGIKVCDRLLVMYKGKIVADLDPKVTPKEDLVLYAMGGSPDDHR